MSEQPDWITEAQDYELRQSYEGERVGHLVTQEQVERYEFGEMKWQQGFDDARAMLAEKVRGLIDKTQLDDSLTSEFAEAKIIAWREVLARLEEAGE